MYFFFHLKISEPDYAAGLIRSHNYQTRQYLNVKKNCKIKFKYVTIMDLIHNFSLFFIYKVLYIVFFGYLQKQQNNIH